MNVKSLALSSAAIACALSGDAEAAVVYETRFLTEGNGRFVAESLPELSAYQTFLGEALGLFQRFAPHRKMNEELLEQRKQEAGTNDFGDDFGGLGDEVAVNPLATAGIADPDTGGLFIDTFSAEHKVIMEITRVGTSGPVFRQEFGQVRVSRLGGSADLLAGDPVAPEIYLLEWSASFAWDPALISQIESEPSALFQVQLSTVPAPGTGVALAGMMGLGVRRRRAPRG